MVCPCVRSWEVGLPASVQVGVPVVAVEVKLNDWVAPAGTVALVRFRNTVGATSTVALSELLHLDVVPGTSPAEQVAKLPLLTVF